MAGKDNKTEADKLQLEIELALRDRTAIEGTDDHLAPEEIVAYHGRSLPPDRASAIQKHLTRCQECTALLLDLDQFEQLGPPPGQAASDSVPNFEAMRRSLDRRLGAETDLHEVKTPTTLRQPKRAPIPPNYWAALAALFIAVVGLSSKVWLFSDQEVGATETFLLAPAAYRDDTDPAFRVPVWASAYVLTLGSVETLGHDKVTAEIRDAAGRVVVRLAALHRADDDTFKLSLSRTRIPPGTYEIVLAGPRGKPKDTYAFELVLEDSSD